MATPATPVGIDPIIAEARERWRRCDEHEEKQRKRILAAKQFRAGDQWDPDIRTAREGKNALQGVAAQPPRPCLTIDRLSQPVRQVSNQIKTANFALTVTPEGHGADDDTAEIVKGYLRRCTNASRDESPIEWAADGAIEAGIGWFRLRTDYVDADPGPDAGIEAFDQEPRLERITNSLSVYCDPSANKPTRSDAQFMFVTEDISRDEFKRCWPWADTRGLDDFMGAGDPKMKSWVSQDIIRVAEYWRCTYEPEAWVALEDGSVMPVEGYKAGERFKPPADINGVKVDAWRIVPRPKVEGFKINAVEILEELPWVGSKIPLIPVLGEELNVDGDIIVRGIISECMDAQRMVNYTYSGAMEIFALAPKSPYVAAAGQVSAYQQIWDTANTYNYSTLVYDPIDIGGTALPPPQRNAQEAPIQAAVELMRVSEESIKAITGIYDASLGATNPRERSGRAIQALQGQADLANSNFGNGVQRAIIYVDEMILEILPKIIRPGQILHLLGVDDKPEKVIVGQHFVTQQGTPIPVSAEEAAQMPKGMAQFYDLAKGRYAVVAKIGKADATKREEGAAALGELIPHLPPEMAAVATPDYVEQLDFEGSHGIAEKLRRALPPQLQDQPDDSQIPEPVKAQMQAMQAKLQEQQQIIETDGAKEQVKQQGMLQKAQIDAQLEEKRMSFEMQKEIRLQSMKDATAIEVARIGAKTAHAQTAVEAMEEGIALDHEAEQAQHDRVHEVRMAQQAHDHALEQGAAGVAGQSALAEQGHGQAMEQAEQAAALEPEPYEPGSGDA